MTEGCKLAVTLEARRLVELQDCRLNPPRHLQAPARSGSRTRTRPLTPLCLPRTVSGHR